MAQRVVLCDAEGLFELRYPVAEAFCRLRERIFRGIGHHTPLWHCRRNQCFYPLRKQGTRAALRPDGSGRSFPTRRNDVQADTNRLSRRPNSLLDIVAYCYTGSFVQGRSQPVEVMATRRFRYRRCCGGERLGFQGSRFRLEDYPITSLACRISNPGSRNDVSQAKGAPRCSTNGNPRISASSSNRYGTRRERLFGSSPTR